MFTWVKSKSNEVPSDQYVAQMCWGSSTFNDFGYIMAQ
jgi:hypothetical protein